jgi:hypothetical protein
MTPTPGADPFTLLSDAELDAMTDRAYWNAARAWRLAPAEAPEADAYYQHLRAEATRRGITNKRDADRRAVDVARDLDATLARRASTNSAGQLTGDTTP